MVARDYDLRGPLLSNSTACASGTIAILNAVRAIRDGQCDLALAGSSEAIHPLFAAGFYNMGVLAEHADPTQACRPFDANRSGFVMGEGAAMFVLESLEHAQERGRRDLCRNTRRTHPERRASRDQSRRQQRCAHGVDSLDAAIVTAWCRAMLRTSTRMAPAPSKTICSKAAVFADAFGRAAGSVCVSANKAMLGHLVNASGSVELAITALALRDGFAPPTLNLTHPDPECDLDCIPLVGRVQPLEHALKLSIAFGGHLAAIALRRWFGREARQPRVVYRQAA